MSSFVFFGGISALRPRSVQQSRRERKGTVREREEVCRICGLFGWGCWVCCCDWDWLLLVGSIERSSFFFLSVKLDCGPNVFTLFLWDPFTTIHAPLKVEGHFHVLALFCRLFFLLRLYCFIFPPACFLGAMRSFRPFGRETVVLCRLSPPVAFWEIIFFWVLWLWLWFGVSSIFFAILFSPLLTDFSTVFWSRKVCGLWSWRCFFRFCHRSLLENLLLAFCRAVAGLLSAGFGQMAYLVAMQTV